MSVDTPNTTATSFPAPSEALEQVLRKVGEITSTFNNSLSSQIELFDRFAAFLSTPLAQGLGPTDRIHLLSNTPCGALHFRNAEFAKESMPSLHAYLKDVDVASLLTDPDETPLSEISIALAAPLQGDATKVTAWSKLLAKASCEHPWLIGRLLFSAPMNGTFAVLAQNRKAFLKGTTATSRRTLNTIMSSNFIEQQKLADGESDLSKRYREFAICAWTPCGGWASAPTAVDHFVRLTALMPALVAIRHVTPPFEREFWPEDGIISALHCASGKGCGQIFDALSEEEKRRVGQYLAIQGGYQPGLAAAIDLLTAPNGTAATLAKLMILGADAKDLGEAVDSTAKLRKLTAAMGSEMTLKIIPHLKSRLQKAVVDMSVTGGTDMGNAT